ncbi:MAG: nodulation protein NfeD [Rhodospirillaceae bacterium]|nr:nodulation protein NfeD [Rhodospirillales bacterium]
MLLLCRGASGDAGTGALLEIDGPIGPAVADYVVNGLTQAGQADRRLVIIQINTPGGLDVSMRRINAAILASPVPVACWVAPAGARAASAGTYILYACHVSAMAPGTNLGAATPVSMGGEMEEAMRSKAVNDAAAYIRSLAELRGRNASWAEQAVREGVSLPASAAVADKVVDLLANDMESLLEGTHGRTVTVARQDRMLSAKGLTVERIEPDFRNRMLTVLTTPEVAYMLLLLGAYGIMFELMNPGAILPGVIGGIALLAGLYAVNLLPVDYAGIGLILLGMALMLAEAFAPSFGILGLGGAIAFALGSLMMFGTDVPGYQLSLGLVVGTTLASALLLILGFAAALRSRRGAPLTGGEAVLGAVATVERWQDRTGQVRLMGEVWNASSPQTLTSGDTVKVTRRDGLTLTVALVASEDHRRSECPRP